MTFLTAKERELSDKGSYSNPQVMELLWKDIWNIKGSSDEK
jgi:hypothetical protein